jgi:hypothetical protein
MTTSNNVADRAISRTLIQFRNSPVFIDLLLAMCAEVWALLDATTDAINLRGPADAGGEVLNAIGRIVGQKRLFIDSGLDQSPAAADDTWYRKLIEARIARNFVIHGSLPEILNYIKLAIGLDVSFYCIGPMTIQLIVPLTVPMWQIIFIMQLDNNSHVEAVTFTPVAATVNIDSVLFVPDNAFTPDVNSIDTAVQAVACRNIY